MTAPTDDANVIRRLDETVARIDILETRVATLTESVNTAVGTMMPKVEALLSVSRNEELPTSRREEIPTTSGSASSTDPASSRSLLEMAELGDGEGILRILVEDHTNIGGLQRTEHGDTALHVAASRGHLKAVIALLGAVKVNTVGQRMRTPLHCAAAHGHLRVVQRLLDMGAQIDAKDASGKTTLELAFEAGKLDVVALLLQRRANFSNETVSKSVSQGHCNIAELLFSNGASVDLCDEQGESLLVQAARAGRWEMVELLLKRGASAAKRKDGKALNLAVEGGNWNVVGMLLQKGAQFNNETLSNIESAAQCNLVELLLLNGVSVDLCNGQGEPLLVQAARAGRWIMVEQLLERGASATKCKKTEECALRYAAEGGQKDLVRLILRCGAASDSDQVKWGLLHASSAAVVWAFVDVVPEAVRGEAGRWGLVGAGENGRLEPLMALLEAGVDVDARDEFEQTALIMAAWEGHVSCVMELLRRGADANAKGEDGDTPLHAASKKGYAECVRALLAVGASSTERNNNRKSPLEVAASDAVRQLFIATSHHP